MTSTFSQSFSMSPPRGRALSAVSQIWHDPSDLELDAEDVKPVQPNPLTRAARWIGSWAVPGLGMFMESYMIFSTGQIKTIWKSAYPTCWAHSASCPTKVTCLGEPFMIPVQSPDPAVCTPEGTYPESKLCDEAVLHSISYTEFAGIMLGMIVLSIVADKLGRKIGSISTSTIMCLGGLLMALAPPFWGLNTMFIIFAAFYLVYGFGVGGEYPISASSAAEKSQAMSGKGAKGRGAAVGMTFSCQGAGAVFGSVIILLLLVVTGQDSKDCDSTSSNAAGYSETMLGVVWRVTYGLGALLTTILALYRIFGLKESAVWEENKARQVRKKAMGIYKYDVTKASQCYRIAFKYYWPRLVATAGTWFLWDVAFYGNKLFSGPIFASMVPDGNLVKINGLILLNNAVALVGYWIAAHLIDFNWCGRVRLQTFGLLMCTILFVLAGALYNIVSPEVLLFLYIFSSFWGQCGPNMTTFVTPTELYPATMRATCHGFSAFMGKAGALLATIAFNYLDTQGIFYVCAAVSFVSIFVTIVFLPDVSQMDMIENDRYLEMILLGRESEYGGEVFNPRNSSLYERWTGSSKRYEPDWLGKHRQQLLQELGQDPDAQQSTLIMEDGITLEDLKAPATDKDSLRKSSLN